MCRINHKAAYMTRYKDTFPTQEISAVGQGIWAQTHSCKVSSGLSTIRDTQDRSRFSEAFLHPNSGVKHLTALTSVHTRAGEEDHYERRTAFHTRSHTHDAPDANPSSSFGR